MQNTLSIERNEMFDLAFRFVTETSENIFLTGKAGTGKTTFLKYLKENCSKNIIVAAPTGVAAINAGGVTLHSLFQLPFHPFVPTKQNREELLDKIRFNRDRQKLLRKMELLVIDEISMVRCDVMDEIDTILKSVRRRHDLPFGGVQLVCIGDLYQLPPVAQHHEWNLLQEHYASPFFFDSLVIKAQMPLLIELNKIYRQKEDSFVSLLNKVRNNRMTADDFEDLHMQYAPGYRPSSEENYITLTSHNNQADQINHRELQKILSPSFTYEANIDGDFPEHMYPAEGTLLLKVGAQVMFLKNDTIYKRYFNGKIGVVKSLKDDEVIVDCDGFDIYVSAETWENSRYLLTPDGKLEQETLGTFTQFPLRLAWAITIHKSQGLTFEKVMIDAGAAFSSGQVYVALSRCTSLDGIILLSKIPPAAIANNENIIKAQNSLTHKGSLAERFEGARQIFTMQLLEEIFSFQDTISTIDLLFFHAEKHKEKLNEDGLKWVAELKHNFRTDKDVGTRFISQVSGLMKAEPVIEKNDKLQSRITAAANHFLPRLTGYIKSIENHPVITEYREAASVMNDHLHEVILSVHGVRYLLEHCRGPFSVTDFLRHKLQYMQPRYSITTYAAGKKQFSDDIAHPELYEELKSWRDKICKETRIPIYMIANASSLAEIAMYLPASKEDLQQISGFGKAKVDKYGDEIIYVVENYCSKNNLKTNMQAKAPVDRKKRKARIDETKTDTKTVSYKLFKEGKTIAEIAKERSFATSTIEGHLAWFVGNGDINIDEIISLEKQLLIKDAAKSYGSASHKILKENLPDSVSYSDIKFVMATEKAGQ